MAKTKEITDVGLMANAASQFFGKMIDERKYRLVEVNPHPDHEGVIKHLIAPINLRHVTIFKESEVVLYVGYDDQIRITEEEWNRIKIHFGWTTAKSQTEAEIEAKEDNQ